MRISTMLGATMVAGAPDPQPATSGHEATDVNRAPSRLAVVATEREHGERRVRPSYAMLRRRLLQR